MILDNINEYAFVIVHDDDGMTPGVTNHIEIVKNEYQKQVEIIGFEAENYNTIKVVRATHPTFCPRNSYRLSVRVAGKSSLLGTETANIWHRHP